MRVSPPRVMKGERFDHVHVCVDITGTVILESSRESSSSSVLLVLLCVFFFCWSGEIISFRFSSAAAVDVVSLK